MADQIERLIEAVDRVAGYLTRLSTYSSVVSLGKASTAVSSAVSGALGSLLKAVQLAGTVTAASAVSGAMKVVYFLQGAAPVVSTSSVTGSMTNVNGLVGSVIGKSGTSSPIMNAVKMAGTVSAVSTISGPAVFMQKELVGSASTRSIVGHADLKIT